MNAGAYATYGLEYDEGIDGEFMFESYPSEQSSQDQWSTEQPSQGPPRTVVRKRNFTEMAGAAYGPAGAGIAFPGSIALEWNPQGSAASAAAAAFDVAAHGGAPLFEYDAAARYANGFSAAGHRMPSPASGGGAQYHQHGVVGPGMMQHFPQQPSARAVQPGHNLPPRGPRPLYPQQQQPPYPRGHGHQR
jgi:hypothetical protein